ncbi:vomeronasal type-2 receptor 26-like [Hyperolius riggenbachi]|uniref:vomeronasal type-2 receptor 26-like n=1 Tax=Hyperolius riggenbachi TaxID=752182 RepID=UPI0035A2F876
MRPFEEVTNLVSHTESTISDLIPYAYFLERAVRRVVDQAVEEREQEQLRPLLKAFASMRALVFAVNEVNLDDSILPNITLGYDEYDSCGDGRKSMQDTLHILSGEEEAPNYSCRERGEVAGFLGDNIAMAQLLGLYGYTKISYGVRDPPPGKSDDLFRSFFTMSQYDKVFYVAVALLMKHFGWTWIGVIMPRDDSADNELRTLNKELTRHGICIEVIVKLSKDIPHMFQVIERSTTKVFVMCGDLSVMYGYIMYTFGLLQDKTVILNESWLMHYYFGLPYQNLINCSLGFLPLEKNIPALFNDVYRTPMETSPVDWYIIGIRSAYCSYASGTRDVQIIHISHINCSGNQTPFHTIYSGDVTPYYVITAVSVLANALHDMQTTMPCTTRGPALCGYREKLKNFVRRLRYTDSIGEDIFFDSLRQLRSRPELSLTNWVMNGTFNKYAVINAGHIYVNESLPEEEWLTVKEDRIVWRTGKVPRSQCNAQCLPGYRKIPNGEIHICCYDCSPCSEGEFSNKTVNWYSCELDSLEERVLWRNEEATLQPPSCTGISPEGSRASEDRKENGCQHLDPRGDSETCWKCPDDQKPNEKKSGCVPKPYEFLSYKEDFLPIFFSLVAVICSAITSCIIKLFRAHWDSPVVKANNRTVSFILLTSILLSFLCVFLFLAHPVDITCMLRQVLYGICFSIALSSILAKTIQVCIAFKATKPGTIWRKWVGSKVSNAIVVSCSCVQVLICVTWLSVSPPYQEYDKFSSPEKIIIGCNEGSAIFFYLVLGYMGLLAGVSLVLAFMVRTLPDSFNEAKYITFSMLVFCSVWIAMIPAYLSTRGKQMVAVQIFAILTSSSGLLGCIFLPKCYHILLNTQVHTRKPTGEK